MDDSRHMPLDPAALRRKASEYRRHAETARDPVVHEGLLRLAALYERMADHAEGRLEH